MTGDEDEDYYEDDKKDYDRDASYEISGKLTEIAATALHGQRKRVWKRKDPGGRRSDGLLKQHPV